MSKPLTTEQSKLLEKLRESSKSKEIEDLRKSEEFEHAKEMRIKIENCYIRNPRKIWRNLS